MRQETIFWWVSVLCSVILRAAGSALPEVADKFALLLEYQTVNGLQHRLDQLLRRVEQIPREEKKDFSISCIMGVCLGGTGRHGDVYPGRPANMARKALKDYHKSIYSFQQGRRSAIAKERSLHPGMKRAAENEEFVVYYQPKVDLPRKRYQVQAQVR